MLCPRKSRTLIQSFIQKLFYSRRSNDSKADVFKVVGAKSTVNEDGSENSPFETVSNWELLAPPGFKFYLPGNVGPAWQNASTITFSNSSPVMHFKGTRVPKISNPNNEVMECVAQECPFLLRTGVREMFPGSEVYDMQLTVITLSSKAVKDIEETTKRFVLAAHNMCNSLKYAGYWADFINPFSGRPYIGSFNSSSLYETDERFRCLGFKVFEKASCKVISKYESSKKFSGNIFTSAPSSSEILVSILHGG